MGRTLAQTIADTTADHLLNHNGMLFSQCVTAVGWIAGTVPHLTEDQGIVELPVSDSSNPGIVVGSALAGRRPIYVIRFQGFIWYNACSLVNYAAKSKEIWGVPCPVFIRSLSREYNGIGPVASSSHHSMIARMPGMPVCAPMTPNEWIGCWNWFLDHDDPVYCSEHGHSFPLCDELDNIINDKPDVTILCISYSRVNAMKAQEILRLEGIVCNIIHLVWLKPFVITQEMKDSICNSSISVVCDSDFEICGISRSISYELMLECNKPVFAFGLKDRTCGASLFKENYTPGPNQIVSYVKKCLKERKNGSIIS